MSTKIDTYRHLDADTSLTVKLTMTDIARDCVKLNYGAHRLLSALVHELRADNALRAAEFLLRNPNEHYGDSELATGIEQLLNKGLFC